MGWTAQFPPSLTHSRSFRPFSFTRNQPIFTNRRRFPMIPLSENESSFLGLNFPPGFLPLVD